MAISIFVGLSQFVKGASDVNRPEVSPRRQSFGLFHVGLGGLPASPASASKRGQNVGQGDLQLASRVVDGVAGDRRVGETLAAV